MLRVMVISYGCEIDKPATSKIQVARVRSFSEISSGGYSSIRKGNVAAVMYLPSNGTIAEESFVDLRAIMSVPVTALCSDALRVEPSGEKVRVLRDPRIRLASLSADGIAALHGQIIMYFTRLKL